MKLSLSTVVKSTGLSVVKYAESLGTGTTRASETYVKWASILACFSISTSSDHSRMSFESKEKFTNSAAKIASYFSSEPLVVRGPRGLDAMSGFGSTPSASITRFQTASSIVGSSFRKMVEEGVRGEFGRVIKCASDDSDGASTTHRKIEKMLTCSFATCSPYAMREVMASNLVCCSEEGKSNSVITRALEIGG
ncbi:hypothetical protein EV363DRAFT_1321893 [Boletus edulis]|nr:hypothetical protein EV363DRAFT_1321893 [Boletus edulis]